MEGDLIQLSRHASRQVKSLANAAWSFYLVTADAERHDKRQLRDSRPVLSPQMSYSASP